MSEEGLNYSVSLWRKICAIYRVIGLLSLSLSLESKASQSGFKN
jgi:hypothetical protein